MQKNLINKRIFWLCLFIVSQNMFCMEDAVDMGDAVQAQDKVIGDQDFSNFATDFKKEIDKVIERQNFYELIGFLQKTEAKYNFKSIPENLLDECRDYVISKNDPHLYFLLVGLKFITILSSQNLVTAIKTSKTILNALNGSCLALPDETEIVSSEIIFSLGKRIIKEYCKNQNENPDLFVGWGAFFKILKNAWGWSDKAIEKLKTKILMIKPLHNMSEDEVRRQTLETFEIIKSYVINKQKLNQLIFQLKILLKFRWFKFIKLEEKPAKNRDYIWLTRAIATTRITAMNDHDRDLKIAQIINAIENLLNEFTKSYKAYCEIKLLCNELEYV